MSRFVIEGGQRLSGELSVQGAKNAALPLLAGCLLTEEEIKITNVAQIRDVDSLCEIMMSLGAEIERTEGVVHVTAKDISVADLAKDKVSSLRGSILLMGALLGRLRSVTIPMPGGDIIGARPIDVHLDAFKQLGATVEMGDGVVCVDGKDMKPGVVILKELSVTATENVLLAAATLPGKTTIHLSAAEPHVRALCELLVKMGARIDGIGTHTITIEGKRKLSGAEYENIYDMIEAGTFILLGVALKAEISVEHVPTEDMQIFFKILNDIGANISITGDTVRVHPADIKGFKIQTLPYPGLATDLQAPFSVVATQARGSSLIHDPMYEGRFKYAAELSKMGAKITVCDPHRIIIEGPTPLTGNHIPSLDIRSGITLIMAGLLARGTTIIDDAEIIDRGYANLPERLSGVGASIKREE